MADGAVYHAIEPNVGIRILKLHPSLNFEDEIVCDLITATITDHPPYEALSYVWGTSEERHLIRVGSEYLPVTINLEEALRHLRLQDRPRDIWADALCIDQSNLEERNNHVQYMAKVYAQCTCDILWLGQDDGIINRGREVMDHFGTLMTLDRQIHNLESDMERSLGALFAAPVWGRAWIIQEIVYSPKVELAAGMTRLSWEDIDSFFDTDRYMKRYGALDAYHAPFSHEWGVRTILNERLAYPHILAQQRRVNQDGGSVEEHKSPPIDILSRFRFTGATDPHDKIIALLSLMSQPLNVTIDYAAPVHELYIEATTKLMEIDGNLDLICQGPWQLHGREVGVEGLPSWVPDFSTPGESRILFAHRGIFHAAGQDAKMDISITPKGILYLTGYFLDKVSVVRTHLWKRFMSQDRTGLPQVPLPFPGRQAFYWMPKTHREEGIRQGNAGLKTYLSEGGKEPVATRSSGFVPSYEAYWRTLMLDCMRRPTRRLEEHDLDGLRTTFSDFRKLPLETDKRKTVDDAIVGLIDRTCEKWSFAITSKGYYCMMPPVAQPKDTIAILNGAKTPIVLRLTSDRRYQWIGACYVHDFMDGQILTRGQAATTFEIA